MRDVDPRYLAAVVATAAAVTTSLRAVPFVVLHRVRDSALLDDLGRRLPAGVMTVLVVYLLRDLPLGHPVAAVPTVVAAAVTVLVHLGRRNALLSIAAGTLVHGGLGVALGVI